MVNVRLEAIHVEDEVIPTAFVVKILKEDISDIEGFSDNEDLDPDFIPIDNEGGPNEESDRLDEDSEVEVPVPCSSNQQKEWNSSNGFDPLPAAPPPKLEGDIQRRSAIEEFYRHVGQSKRRRTIPLPDDRLRTAGAVHLPEIPPGAKPSRCRFPGCYSPKCRFWCSICKVFLCLNSNRNCFKEFHEL